MIGAVPYMNGKPLTRGLDCIEAVPSKLARMLQAGEIEAGLVSAAACFTGLPFAKGIAIACDGECMSVRLFTRKESIRRVALDTSSLTSAILAQVLLPGCEFVPMPPDPGIMLDTCDAAVLIGDPAMRVGGEYVDLGTMWKAVTGLPFVFAVWAVTRRGLVPELTAAKERGLAEIEAIASEESARLGFPLATCRRYLTGVMQYDLTDAHLAGLRLFYEMARDMELAPPEWTPEIWDE
ncbi:MAG: menaquinone biosynthetic enzyme MqnA/MqnD family protein [Armatimonadota bacterium]